MKAPFYTGKFRKYQAAVTTAGLTLVIAEHGRDSKGLYAITTAGTELRFVSRIGWYVKTPADDSGIRSWIKGVK